MTAGVISLADARRMKEGAKQMKCKQPSAQEVRRWQMANKARA